MSGGRVGAIRGDFLRLFDGEATVGLGDGRLLERFAGRRDEAAFEALVARHGAMVLGVCRRMLADPHDADDAFQATFLVLARRAGSIADGDRLGPWLHGVAVRVARRARAVAARRAARERVGDVPDPGGSDRRAEWAEVRARIDEEIARLPESQRRPVVLCDVEGLNRDEAAARLGWTPNMVRGRLERARSRLRDRLTRRGLSPSGAWLALASPPALPKPALVAATARLALTAAGLATGPAVALSRGVLLMMMLAKWKLAGTTLLAAGAVVAGSGLLAAGQGPGGAKAPDPPPAVPVAVPAKPDGPKADSGPRPRTSSELARARVEAAKVRLDAQQAFYAEGRITVDRVINASRGLMVAERDAADAKPGRVAARGSHVARLREILKKERSEVAVGRATAADVAEVDSALLDAEFDLAKENEAPDDPPSAPASKPNPVALATTSTPPSAAPNGLDALEAIIRQRWQENLRYSSEKFDSDFDKFPREVDLKTIVSESDNWRSQEWTLADAAEGRARADAAHLDRLRKIVSKAEAALKQGATTQAVVAEALESLKVEEGQQADHAKGHAILRSQAGTSAPVPMIGPGTLPPPNDLAGLGKARVASAYRRLYIATEEFLGNGDFEHIVPVLKTSRDMMDAELDAAGSKADRLGAIRGHLDRIDAVSRLPRFVDEVRDGRVDVLEVARLRDEFFDAQYRLAAEAKTPDPAGSGVVPAPGGPLSAPKPGPSSEVKPRSPMGEAVAAFNARWSSDPVGRDQPPLTEDEVIAAIRFWLPGREPARFIKDFRTGMDVRTRLTPGDAPVAEFKAIAETGRLPDGATFDLARRIDLNEDHLYGGWWISIVLRTAKGQTHGFSIRERLIRAIPLEEALALDEAALRDQAGDSLPFRASLIESIKNWKERIDRRDKKARQ